MKKKKFRYNVTLINVSLVLLIFYLLYINSLMLVFLIGYSIPILIIDFLLQAYFKDNKVKLFISNVILILVLIIVLKFIGFI